jgi:hypothetical protein
MSLSRIVLASPPESKKIAAFESALFFLKIDSSDPKQIRDILPGTYVGFISGSDAENMTNSPSGNPIAPLEIQFIVPGPHPALTERTIWVYRSVPWANVENYEFDLPLSEPSTYNLSLLRYALESAGRYSIIVPADSTPVGIVDNLRFKILNLDGAGKYEGPA